MLEHQFSRWSKYVRSIHYFLHSAIQVLTSAHLFSHPPTAASMSASDALSLSLSPSLSLALSLRSPKVGISPQGGILDGNTSCLSHRTTLEFFKECSLEKIV